MSLLIANILSASAPILSHGPGHYLGSLPLDSAPTLANSSYTPRELAHQIQDSGTGAIFVHPDLFPVVIETFAHLGIAADQARRRVGIMSYGDEDHADEKAANIGSEWT